MHLSPLGLALLLFASLAAAFIGVVTGGNSLVTVPVMLALGLPPRESVATNMFAVTFLAATGSYRFARAHGGWRRGVRWDITLPLLPLTLVASWVGGHLVASVDERTMERLVAGSLVAMLVVLALRPGFGAAPARHVSRARFAIGLALATVLGVYGGLFSGGYTTLLTFVVVGLLGASLGEAVGLTKIVNFASSAIASVEMARAHLVDLRIGVPMALAMIVGATVGADLAVKLGARFVRALFLATVAGLATKVVVVDLLLKRG